MTDQRGFGPAGRRENMRILVACDEKAQGYDECAAGCAYTIKGGVTTCFI